MWTTHGEIVCQYMAFIYDSPKLETAQGQPTGKWIYSQSRPLLTNKKKLLIVAIARMILKNMLTQTHQTQKSTYRMTHLNETLQQKKLSDKYQNDHCLPTGRGSRIALNVCSFRYMWIAHQCIINQYTLRYLEGRILLSTIYSGHDSKIGF